MFGRIVLGSLVAVLINGTAYAEDKELACMNRLAETETLVDQRVNAKALDEGEVEDVNMLLDEADAFCTDGEYGKADAALASVKKMVTPAPE